jgi:hypothetical protein
MRYHQIFSNSLANGLGCTGNWVGCMEIDPKEAMLKIYNILPKIVPQKKRMDYWNSNHIDTEKAL